MTGRLRNPAWYLQYSLLKEELADLKHRYEARCLELGRDPLVLQSDVWTDLITRAVHESNWQEGVELEEPRTRELVVEALQHEYGLDCTRIDTALILDRHKRIVTGMKKSGARPEEIAALNLASAHSFLRYVVMDSILRMLAKAEYLMEQFIEKFNTPGIEIPAEAKATLEIMEANLERSRNDKMKLFYPTTGSEAGKSQYMDSLKKNRGFEITVLPLEYIHFLHSVTMMGMLPALKCGRFRRHPVSVGNESVLFPAHPLVEPMMNEFATRLGDAIASAPVGDTVLHSAKLSYQFVAIHPYADGNGRISRLIMNLVLYSGGYMPAYLKADGPGRHRYSVALKRANRGSIEGLAALISRSLIKVYTEVLAAMGSRSKAVGSPKK